jgi:hypothetical protein
VIVSFVTETAEEVGKLLRKRKLAQRDISTRLIPEGVFGEY